MTDLRAVLFGHPVNHSRSPEIFAALAEAGGPTIELELHDVAPDAFDRALDDLRGGRWDAALVTIPHKEAAARGVDERTEIARLAGAVNCIARRDGRLVGTNTDGPGFIAGLRPTPPTPCTAVVLGAGGAARGVAAALSLRGARLTVVTRDPVRRAAEIPAWPAELMAWHDPALPERLDLAEIVVQATPLGMTPDLESCPPVPFDAIGAGQRVVDLVYTPWETEFLRRSRERLAWAINGWPMLVHQAAAAVDHWLGEGAGAALPAAMATVETRDPRKAGQS